MRIIFMGTPDFAVPSLKILVENNLNVVAVITAPDKPKGRGKKLGTSAVKDYATSVGLTVLQPTNLKDGTFQDQLRSLKADLQVIVAFRMLPEAVWSMPTIGSINLHGSLLPQYRGAAPINWAIMNGEKETGVTTFFLQHEIDTGKIIFQEREPILPEDNVGSVYSRLMHKGAELVLKTVKAIENNDYPQIDQREDQELISAPKIFRATCEIDWNQNVERVLNHISGLSPYPAAWTTWNERTIKVFKASESKTSADKEVGQIWTEAKIHLFAQCADGTIALEEVQLEGKKRMKTADLLRGMQL